MLQWNTFTLNKRCATCRSKLNRNLYDENLWLISQRTTVSCIEVKQKCFDKHFRLAVTFILDVLGIFAVDANIVSVRKNGKYQALEGRQIRLRHYKHYLIHISLKTLIIVQAAVAHSNHTVV